MSRTCTICTRDDREEIDARLVSNEPQRTIARRLGCSRAALQRHAVAHVSPALSVVAANRTEASATAAFVSSEARLDRLAVRIEALLERSEADGRSSLSIQAMRELRGAIMDRAKLLGETHDGVQVAVVNLAQSPDWVDLRTRIMVALLPYPEARQAVADSLAPGIPRSTSNLIQGRFLTPYRAPDDDMDADDE